MTLKNLTSCGCAAIAFSLLLGNATAQTTRTYDVGTVLAPVKRAFPQDDGKTGLFLPTVLVLTEALRTRDTARNITWGFPAAGLSRERLLALASDARVAGPDGVSLWRERLTFEGSAERHGRLRDLLMMLEESLHPAIRLEVSFVEGVVAERAVLGAEDVDALLARSSNRVVHRTVIRSDVAEFVRSGSQQSFIRDWDVEVATKATVYDPKTTRAELGLSLGLSASVLADGRIELLIGLQEAEARGKLDPRQMLGDYQGSIHHPRIDSRLIISRGVIADGGALVLGGVSDKHGLCVIRCRREPRQPSGRSGLFQAIPLGDLLHPLPHPRGIRPPPRQGEEERASRPEQAVPTIQGALRSAVGVDSPSDLEWVVLGNRLVVLGDDDLMQTLSKRIEGQVRKRAATRQTLSLAIRTGEIDDELAEAHLAGETNADKIANKVPQVGMIAALPGHPFQHIEGMETTYIRDQSVEVAAKAVGSNPHVQVAFSGFSLVGTLRNGVNGTLSLDGTFYRAKVDAKRLDTRAAPARDVDPVTRHFVQQEIRSVPMRRGRWQVLSLRKNPGGSGYLVLMVRVAL